jgi:hypothetical protein
MWFGPILGLSFQLETRSQTYSLTSHSQTTLCLSSGWGTLPHKNNDEKEKLNIMLSANKQMSSLTTGCWTSIQNINYVIVTCHYINEGWVLN